MTVHGENRFGGRNFDTYVGGKFMDVVEQVQKRLRQEFFAMVDLPGPSLRARLFALLRHAFHCVKTISLLQVLTGHDYDQVFQKVPPEIFQKHVATDRAFIMEPSRI